MSGLPPDIGAQLGALREELDRKTRALAAVEGALATAEQQIVATRDALAEEQAAHQATRDKLAGVQVDLSRFTKPVADSGGAIVLRQVAETPDGKWHATPADAQHHLAVNALCATGMSRSAAEGIVARAGTLAPLLAQIAAGAVITPPQLVSLSGHATLRLTGQL